MESAVIDPDAWDLTIVRAQGLRLMRPEKAWRPIVTLEIDEHNRHETVLGVDGQNPNLKQFFKFYDVEPSSSLEMRVWHRSQSKKKSKKRILVASATHSLGDLLKRVEFEGTGKPAKGNLLDIRLSCQIPSKRCSSSSSKGKPQNGASLTIKLTPPRAYGEQAQSHDQRSLVQSASEVEVGYSSEGGSSSSSSHPAPSILSSSHLSESESKTLIDVQPPSPTHSETRSIPSPPGLRRRKKRKRIKGFFSDDDPYSCTASEAESDSSSASGSASGSFNSSVSFFGNAASNGHLPLEDLSFESFDDIDDIMASNSPKIIPLRPKPSIEAERTTKTRTTTVTTETTVDERTSVRSWIAGSLLPQHILAHKPLNISSDSLSKEEVPPYTETDITTVGAGGSTSVPHSPTEPEATPAARNAWWEQFLGNFTFYLDLRDAQVDSQFEMVLQNLRMEWTFMGGFLAALGAVDVAVLAIGDDAVMPINLTPLSLRAIALSSTFTGLGLTSLAYFILRYSLSPAHLFRVRALDVYGSYVFFALSARVPTLCMVASALTLLAFLAVIAFEVWPVGVVVGCFLVGMLMSLQFLVYGCHMFVKGVIGGVRGIAGLVRRVVLRGAASAAGASGTGSTQSSSGSRSEGASRLRVKLAKMKATKPTAGTSAC